MTDWLWEKRESEEQRERVMSVKRNASFFLSVYEKDRRYALKQKEVSTYPSNVDMHFLVSNNDDSFAHHSISKCVSFVW